MRWKTMLSILITSALVQSASLYGQELPRIVDLAAKVGEAQAKPDWSKKPRGYKLAPLDVREKRHEATAVHTHHRMAISKFVIPPDSWDSRTKGWIVAVSNQADCGDCHYHGTVGTFSDSYLVAGWPASTIGIGFSYQQLLNCGGSLGGCDGGDEWADGQWIAQNGLALASAYPGAGSSPARCGSFSGTVYKPASQFYVSTSTGIPTDQQLQTAIMQYGSVCVAVAASTPGWNSYQFGNVITDQATPNDVDHCVRALGWKKENSKIIYIFQNSWDGWGGTTTAGDGTGWIQSGSCQFGTESYCFTAPPSPVTPTPIPPGPTPTPPPPLPVNPATVTTIVASAPIPAGTSEVLPQGATSTIQAAAQSNAASASALAALVNAPTPTPTPGSDGARITALEGQMTGIRADLKGISDLLQGLKKEIGK
jgi:hypothetical protein